MGCGGKKTPPRQST